MARKKKEETELVRQTEYRTKKNSGKNKKAKTEDTPTKETSTKIVEKEQVSSKENELSTEFVEKNSSKKNKVINEEEVFNTIQRDNFMENKKTSRIFVNFFLCFILLIGLGFFLLNLYLNKNNLNILNIVSSLLLILFTIFFVPIGLKSRNKGIVFLAALLLGTYFSIGIYNNLANNGENVTIINSGIKDFTGKSLTEVVKWAEKNNITLNQEYEYSDMIEEYDIINQSIKAGTKLDDIKELTIVISEGPNPNKEIIVPDMVSWNDERVINFVEENYLSNVIIEFVQSDKATDTVIEQSKAGNLKRNEELKITFSYGEELGYDEVKIIDFTKKTEFEVMFYMKQHHLKYEFTRDFSDKIKRNLAMSQDKKPGTSVKVDDETVKVTFSKGKEIKVPDLTSMSMSEITTWVIKNRLKLEFTDKYDEKIKANNVISANYKKGDKVEQGELIKVVISKGSLKMPKFASYEEFRAWADKYEIKYEEKHEFSSTVKIGEVISYSYKTGDVIKNDDAIIVTISDGEEVEVPNLDGLSKSQAESKLDKLGLNYSFVYSYSDKVAEGLVIKQSISSGSKVSSKTTITITLSKGKKPASENNSSSNNSSSSSSSNNNNNNNNNDNKPSCVANKETTVYIYDELFDFSNPKGTCSKIKAAYKDVNFACSYVNNSGLRDGMLQNSSAIDGKTFNNCETVTLKIVQN